MLDPLPLKTTYSPWPFRCALALVGVTFPLIWVGGLVTTYDAGMAVPDWPGTYGYNLFLYPWTTWVAGPFDLFIEHGHRLLGALAGFVTIALLVSVWTADRRPWTRWLALGALVLVCLQGALGGARVLLDQRTLALIHGCVGPAFLAYATLLAVVTSPWWRRAPADDVSSAAQLRLVMLTAGLAYAQLVLGAHVRHVAPDSSPGVFRAAVVFHVVLALVLFGHATAVAWFSGSSRHGAVRFPARCLAVLVGIQVMLGAATWVAKYGWPLGLTERLRLPGTTIVANSLPQAMVTTAHVAMGALILCAAVVTLAAGLRVRRPLSVAASASAVLAWEAVA